MVDKEGKPFNYPGRCIMSPEKVTFEKSSEYLRLALPLMSRYTVPFTPQSYAVWYEYVSGGNLSLKEELDRRIEQRHIIDEPVTADLYLKYIDPRDLERLEKAQDVLRAISDSVVDSLLSANGEVNRYEESLQRLGNGLTSEISQDEFRDRIVTLEASTRKMSDGTHTLQQYLERSRYEAETLRKELANSRAEAVTDTLTGLANRKGLDDRIAALRTSDFYHDTTACVLFCDIDNFKEINDTYGHLLGDKVIKVVADVLKGQVKGKDLACRYGGEEFLILLPETGIKGATALAESIRRAVEGCRVVKPRTGEAIRQVTISVGIARILPGEEFKDTIARADVALYAAKNKGRNRVEVACGATTLKAVSE
jgi:diguanylate cyclase